MGAARLGRGRAFVGQLLDSGSGGRRPSGIRGRDGCDRAWLRHGLRFGVARQTRRETGRHRQLAEATRNRPADAGAIRDRFPLHLGNAEDLPFADASFDLAISEYGASIWCDPYKWIPEAARVLRPGGRLVFLVNGVLVPLCSAPDDTLDIPVGECFKRPLFGMHRFEWPDDDSVEFHLPHGEMIRVLRSSGFEIEQLIELQPAADATATVESVPLAWARQWPADEIWCARKRT